MDHVNTKMSIKHTEILFDNWNESGSCKPTITRYKYRKGDVEFEN